MLAEFCCSVVVSLVCYLCWTVYMKVVPEPNTVSDRIHAFLDDPQWPEHIKDPQLKQIKKRTSSNIY